MRVSGATARAIGEAVFRLPSGRPPRTWKSHQMRYGRIVEGADAIDEALVVLMAAPHSYTGEDVLEIHAHGGTAGMQRILRIVLAAGARLAQPGEFTRRAFTNGRLDLAQAEAVIDIIRARTEASLSRAFSQFSGGLSQRVRELRERILTWLAQMEAQIDFPDDDVPPLPQAVLQQRADDLLGHVQRLLDTAEEGRIYRDGVRVAIVGKPNVGKSSLLNALLGENRAIVTEIAGTTRDTIEEWASVGGIPICVVDTAGIRHADDVVESLGIERSRQAAESADLLLVMLDRSRPRDDQDEAVLQMAAKQRHLVLLNKCDLPAEQEMPDAVHLSLSTGDGLERLRAALVAEVMGGRAGGSGDVVVASARHREALLRSRESLQRVCATVATGLPVDFITIDLRAALDAMGEVTGQSITDDVLDKIFSEFCLGK